MPGEKIKALTDCGERNNSAFVLNWEELSVLKFSLVSGRTTAAFVRRAKTCTLIAAQKRRNLDDQKFPG
jgi:hypothetical protein